MKNKISKKLLFIFIFFFFLVAAVYWLSPKTDKASFTGTVKTGAQLGEVKSYCPNGLYLVAEEGKFLVNQATVLQLRLPDQPDGTKMLADPKYAGQKVKVAGQYPAQEVFCEALLCECDDYLLVENINSAE